jgi:signal transduction histidine kinase
VILGVIIFFAIILSLATYEYSSRISSGVLDAAIDSNERNTQIQASDLSHIISNEIQEVVSNLATVSDSSAIEHQSTTEVTTLLEMAQNITYPFTDYYGWTAANGTLLADSNQTIMSIDIQHQSFASTAEIFLHDAETSGTTYITNASVSPVTHLVRILVLEPIYNASHFFSGMVESTLNLGSLGTFINSQISPKILDDPSLADAVTLFDSNGTELYTSHNPTHVGLNLFTQSENFTSAALPSQREAMISFMQEIVENRIEGVGSYSIQNNTRMIAYQPVFVNASNNQQLFFGMLLIGINQEIPLLQAAEISSIGTFTAWTIGGIGAGTVFACLAFLRWNRRLEKIVEERTAELRKTNENLKVKDIAQINFIGSAAYEVGASVRPLLGITELMRESMRDSVAERGTKSIEISESELKLMEKSVKHLNELTRNILDITRLENLSQPLKRETFDLGKDIQERIDDIAGKHGGTSKIVFFPPNEPLRVEGDRGRLGEVVTNLLENAVRFSSTSRRPSIVISAKKYGNDAEVKVMDNGSGIDADVMPKLFTKYFTKADSGIGLGLYISKLIVEVHGGKIWAENNEGLPGASFVFTLPLASTKGETRRNLEEEHVGTPASQRRESTDSRIPRD